VKAQREIDPSRLPDRLEAIDGIERVLEAAERRPAYLVGGAVRDLLLGESSPDLDIALEEDIGPFLEALGGEAAEHERFETASVVLGEMEVDVARTRTETYPSPGELPEVEPASIEEDLARRDFTVNAMAVPLGDPGELLDPHHGLDDLREGILRVLHELSFLDDPTRALRAARYAARLGLELEPGTERLLRAADLSTVSEDRVTAELAQIAGEVRPSSAMFLIEEWGLLDLGRGPRLATALERLFATRPEWAEFADRQVTILLAVAPGDHPRQLRKRAAKLASVAPDSPAQRWHLADGHAPGVLALARAAGASWLDDYVTRLRHVELEIWGYDLLEAGIPEGPAIGRGLDAALTARLNGEVSSHEEELRVALEAAREG
jgi:tRNA nucleotidyltransferase (CCA-adding enzyme)